MTKAFTAAAISLLVDDNEKFPKVQWTTPVSEILPEDFILREELHTKEITLEDILCHRTGLPEYAIPFFYLWIQWKLMRFSHEDAFLEIYSKNSDTPKSVTRKLRHLPLTAPPRARYEYNNLMYVVAAHIAGSLTRQSLGSFLRQKIWEPLGMKNTFYGMTDLKDHGRLDEMAKGYRWDKTTEIFEEIPWIEQPEASGAGEMISSALDMSLFIRSMMLKNGPLSQDAYAELVKPRIDIEDEGLPPFMDQSKYALGWAVDSFHGVEVAEHDGCVNGFGGYMTYVPSKNLGVLILLNTADAFLGHQKIAWGLIEELLGVTEEKRFDWDEKARKEEKEEEEVKSIEELYPDLPTERAPLSVPISAFMGAYEHPGYGVLVVERRAGKLFVDGTDRTWRFELGFEHVHEELWVANTVDVDTKERGRMKAKFRVGDDKEVKAMGIRFVEDMGDELVWFERKG